MFELQKDIGLFSPISRALLLLQASLAQSAERVTFNHVVASSSLARGDIVFGFSHFTLLTPVLVSFMRTLVSLTGKIGFFGGLVQNRFYGGF